MAAEKQNLKPRQPVTVVMGHVDHGKTTLLDYIRKANVASREAGGITQAVGAYEIEHKGKKITFIDTPGHEAFGSMRSRGAHAADLAILVVAADEGIKPQTKEAIRILNETHTTFIVALNKIDKPGADAERVKNELAAEGVLLEGYGGQVSWHAISAKTGEGVDELLDLIILAAELEGLTYDPAENPAGFILETRLNKNRGTEATVIVQNGILRRGDEVATPSARGKVKILENFLGKACPEIPAGAPGLILGFEGIPQAGEKFSARDISAVPVAQRVQAAAMETAEEGTLRLILKADDAGSLEALQALVIDLEKDKPRRIVHSGVGDIGEGDVKLAVSTGAIIIGFKSTLDKSARLLAEAHKVKIITSDVVYDLVKAIQEFWKAGEVKIVGKLGVLAVFNQSNLMKQVVGGRVTEGVFKNKSLVNIKRGENILGTGRVLNLQSQKKDTHQADEGKEAGLMLASDISVAVGDELVINE